MSAISFLRGRHPLNCLRPLTREESLEKRRVKMGEKGIERRLCQRFKIPGATVSYRKEKLFSSKTKIDEEFCPVLDLSRGGIRFLTQKPLKFKSKVTLQ